MVICMKTTVEIPDKTLSAAKQFAAKKKLTLRELIITALQQILEGPSRIEQYELPDCSVGGKGLNPEFETTGWAAIRDTAYGMEKK